MEVLIGALLLALVATFVLWPLHGEAPARAPEDPVLADLEARKEAKYREIRDAQLDHASGKLSDEDFRGQDAQLRSEAVELLKQLDRARERGPESAKGPSEGGSP